MKTNKQKALELINSKMADSNDLNHNQMINTSLATSAVIIASKPDWFYPDKGEFPELYEFFVNQDGEPCEMRAENRYLSFNTNQIGNINNIKAWTYLPKFEEE